MAVSMTIATHGWAYPSKVLAATGGKYVYNITIEKDHDNGEVVGRGEFIELDRYKEADATEVEALIVDYAPNGNFYMEIVNPGDALILRNVPVTPYKFNATVKQEKVFYNEKGDTVRGYELAKGDVWEVSPECFGYEAKIGDSVTATNGKFAKKTAGNASNDEEGKG